MKPLIRILRGQIGTIPVGVIESRSKWLKYPMTNAYATQGTAWINNKDSARGHTEWKKPLCLNKREIGQNHLPEVDLLLSISGRREEIITNMIKEIFGADMIEIKNIDNAKEKRR